MSFKSITRERRAIAKALDYLASTASQVWGYTAPGSCVTEAHIIAKVLTRYFGIPSTVIAADMSAWNSASEANQMEIEQRLKDGHPPEKMFDDLGMKNGIFLRLSHKGHDGTDPNYEGRTNPRHYGPDAEGYDGHTIVQTPNFIIDSTLGQINRDERIQAPKVMVYERKHFGPLSDDYSWLMNEVPIPTAPVGARPVGYDADGNLHPLDMTKVRVESLGMLTPHSIKPEKVAIVKVGEDTWLALCLRPDISVEKEMEIHQFDNGWFGQTNAMSRTVEKRLRRSGA